MFSKDAKDEIARAAVGRTCCASSFVRGLVRFAKLASRAGLTRLARSERGPVIRAVVSATHQVGLSAQAVASTSARAGRRWQVLTAQPTLPAAMAAVPPRNCCRRTLLRVAFLSGGSVSDPHSAYHLEFVCPDDAAARLLSETMTALQIDAALSRRRRRPLVYLKDAQGVATLLAQMGATHAVLQLEALRALRQTKNSIRRAVNGETANAARSAVVGARQREAAVRMLRKARVARLSATVHEAARLRIAHPSGTLAELAKLARPPISKAAMASRLRLLERLAKR